MNEILKNWCDLERARSDAENAIHWDLFGSTAMDSPTQFVVVFVVVAGGRSQV
jgi:hypothetical protein